MRIAKFTKGAGVAIIYAQIETNRVLSKGNEQQLYRGMVRKKKSVL